MARSKRQVAFTCVLVVFSAYIAILHFPYWTWLLAAFLGAVSLASLILRVGWVIPCIVAGVYTGMILDADVKGGTIESQMWETVTSICSGAVGGFFVGLVIDSVKGERRISPK